MKGRGKLLALSTAALGLLVLIAAGFMGKERLLKSWYLYQLEYGKPANREHAARKLSEIRAQDAVPAIIRAALWSADANGIGATCRFSTVNLSAEGEPFQDAIVQMDEHAYPGLLVCLAGEKKMERCLSAQILEIIYAKHNESYKPHQSSWKGSTKREAPLGVYEVSAWEILTALQTDGTLGREVRQAAAEALKKIDLK